MKIPSPQPPLLPPRAVAASLFSLGAGVGPLVDALHNQCLLVYDFAPVSLPNPATPSASPLLCSSLAVPPLLGVAYVVLGWVLPRVIETLAGAREGATNGEPPDRRTDAAELRNRAALAVASTAAIIRLSDVLQTHDAVALMDRAVALDASARLGILAAACAAQWLALDGSPAALAAAALAAVGGPLAELPFVAHGFWHYLPAAADYVPLGDAAFRVGGAADAVATKVLGGGYRDLALSSITGPCYFAVTTDAIALGRYVYQIHNDELRS